MVLPAFSRVHPVCRVSQHSQMRHCVFASISFHFLAPLFQPHHRYGRFWTIRKWTYGRNYVSPVELRANYLFTWR